MKIGKYPVKHSYKIPRLIADVFTLALTVLIFSATFNFLGVYEKFLDRMRIGSDIVQTIADSFDPMISWRHWLSFIFPVLAVLVSAVYLILVLTSRKFSRVNVTKRTAQGVYDIYAFCVSLCKIPVLLALFDYMVIIQQRMLGMETSLFSIQAVLDVIIIAILVRFSRHRIRNLTERRGESADTAVKIKSAAKPAEEREAPENDNNDDKEKT